MAKINSVHIPLATRYKILKEKHHLRTIGHENFKTLANKRGEAVLLTYSTPEHDELLIANVYKPDGTETISFYKTRSEKGYRKPYQKVIETWDKVKNNLTFKKETIIQYNGISKIPEVISTMYSDNKMDNGVEIVRTFPFQKYAEHFKRPTE